MLGAEHLGSEGGESHRVGAGDLHLQADSPARDAGAVLDTALAGLLDRQCGFTE